MRVLILFLSFFSQISSASGGFDFSVIMRSAQECNPKSWKELPFATQFGALDSTGAVILEKVNLTVISGPTESKMRTEVSGLSHGGLGCSQYRLSGYQDRGSPRPFREVWTLQDRTKDERYRGWTTSYFFPDNPEVEGPATLHNSHSFHCIVRFEDFIKDYRAVPIDQLCKGQSAQTKKKFIENLKRLSETMRKKVTSSAGVE